MLLSESSRKEDSEAQTEVAPFVEYLWGLPEEEMGEHEKRVVEGCLVAGMTKCSGVPEKEHQVILAALWPEGRSECRLTATVHLSFEVQSGSSLVGDFGRFYQVQLAPEKVGHSFSGHSCFFPDHSSQSQDSLYLVQSFPCQVSLQILCLLTSES